MDKILFNLVLITLAVIIGIVSQKYLGADNIVEQDAEFFIKEETGLDIDLSPPLGLVRPLH